MNLYDAVNQLVLDTRGVPPGGPLSFSAVSSIGLFLPEITICATIVLMLMVRVFSWGRRVDVAYLALAGSVLAFFLAAVDAPAVGQRVEFFTGMLVYDSFTVYVRSLLLLFVVLLVPLTQLTGVPRREDASDIYTLVLGATLGMCLMVSANHLLMVFLAVEMASVPSYALVALMKRRYQASEAALKYAVYGAATAGVMLYGISLVAGIVNSAHLPTIARELAVRLPHMSGGEAMVLSLAGLMVLVGLAFKLSAVPFHFWCPDVFEGATAEVNAFLSVASKAAALGLLVRVVIGIGVVVPPGLTAGEMAGARQTSEVAEAARRGPAAGLILTRSVTATLKSSPHAPREEKPMAHDAATNEVKVTAAGVAPPDPTELAPLQGLLGKLVALLAIVTCTFGNLAAYGQTNIKRLLAYSTIAHAGYMMMAIPPLMALASADPAAAEQAVAALAVYIAVYLFMNLGAFSVVAFLRNAMGSEQIDDYAGLFRQCPGVVICFAIMLFSLLGIPPLAGFVGKFAVFAALAEGYLATGQGYLLLLLIAGGVNTAISLFYYVRVVKVMTMAPDPQTRGPVRLPLESLSGFYLVAVTLPTVILFFAWEFLNQFALRAAQQLLG